MRRCRGMSLTCVSGRKNQHRPGPQADAGRGGAKEMEPLGLPGKRVVDSELIQLAQNALAMAKAGRLDFFMHYTNEARMRAITLMPVTMATVEAVTQ